MSLQDIYNLIIASIPTLTAILTCVGILAKIIKTLADLKHNVGDSQEKSETIIKELRIQNQALQEQSFRTQQELNQLTHDIQKVVDKVDTEA